MMKKLVVAVAILFCALTGAVAGERDRGGTGVRSSQRAFSGQRRGSQWHRGRGRGRGRGYGHRGGSDLGAGILGGIIGGIFGGLLRPAPPPYEDE